MFRIKQAFYEFMYGRHGVDNLSRAMVLLAVVLAIINLFIGSLFIYLFNTAILVLAFLRAFSKNTTARTNENNKFLKFENVFKREIKLIKMKYRDRKICRYRKCPICKAVMRLPLKKGRHTVVCRQCGYEFKVNI